MLFRSVSFWAGLRPVVTLNNNVKISGEGEILADAEYKIEHYKQDTNLSTYTLEETETGKGPVNTQITAISKTYTGFTEDISNGNRVPSGAIMQNGGLVLKLYYNRNSYPVTLNSNEGTINEGNITNYIYGVGATLPTNVTKTGYKFEGWYETGDFTGTPVTKITENDIEEKTYYAKFTKRNDLSYTVNYLEEVTNKEIKPQKVVNNQVFESVIKSSDEAIEIDGYNYAYPDKAELVIGVNENVINIYYTKVTGLSYTVNFLEKGTGKILFSPDIQGDNTFGDIIKTSSRIIEIDGYNYDSCDKEELIIGTGENVINIYYTKRNDLSYEVNYLEKDTNKVLKQKKIVENQTFETKINIVDEIIEINGYEYNSVDKEELTIGVKENIINIYYTKEKLILTSEVKLEVADGKGGIKLDWSSYDITNKYFVIYRKKENAEEYEKIISLEDKLCANNYIDELANDKNKPNAPVINIQVLEESNSAKLMTTSTDNGTKYTYYIESYDAIEMNLLNKSNSKTEQIKN